MTAKSVRGRKTRHLIIWVEPEKHARFKAAAKAGNTTIARICRDLINEGATARLNRGIPALPGEAAQ